MNETAIRRTLRRARVAVVLLCVVACSGIALAQDEYDGAEFDSWTDFATVYKFGGKWRYDGDYGIRSLLTSRGFWQYYLRPSARYRAKRWLMLHGGIAYFRTNFDDGDPTNEIRPWVGLRLVGPRPGRYVFSHYFRVEWRSFYRGDDERESNGRARYQLQFTSPRFKIGGAEGFYWLTFVELFHNFGSSLEGFEVAQFRFDIGAGKQLNRGLRLELNYLLQKVAVEDLGLEPNDHILRVRLNYSFN